MFKSMTGYGKSSLSNDLYDIDIEIKSLNSKYFDLRYYSSKEYSYLEMFVAKILKEKIGRGNIEVRLNIINLQEPNVKINENLLMAIWKAGKKVREVTKMDDELSLDRLLLYPGVIEMKQENSDDNFLKESLETVLLDAISKHQEMAVTEGEVMKSFFISSLTKIKTATENIKKIIPTYKSSIYDEITTNIKALLQDEITDEILRRIVVEVAFYVDRNDVNEELVRLLDHVDKFEKVLSSNKETNGKTLNFILQEMHREANTLGSKFSIPDTFSYILIIKEEIDKCKEMILNVQ